MKLQWNLHIRSSPFVAVGLTTPALMREVLYALIPVLLAAFCFFGVSALLLVVSAVAGALLTEYLGGTARPRGSSLKDGSALLTGVLVGLTLPPGLPIWMAFLGGVAAIGLGKLPWGGLGHNIFNPALVGRAFLQAAFPTAITTWAPPAGPGALNPGNFAAPFMHAPVDAVATATPLGLMKFQHEATGLDLLLAGNTAGSLGETSAALLLLIGLWMVYRKIFDWRIPASILLTVTVFSGLLHALGNYPTPGFMLFSGGLLFGTVFMATDPVTSPTVPRGAWIFGAGIGILVVLIRLFGGLPEGVMYAILLMNAAAPQIEQRCQPTPFGRGKKR